MSRHAFLFFKIFLVLLLTMKDIILLIKPKVLADSEQTRDSRWHLIPQSCLQAVPTFLRGQQYYLKLKGNKFRTWIILSIHKSWTFFHFKNVQRVLIPYIFCRM